MELNKLQKEFVEKAIHWFHHSSSRLIQLAGYAGTGKSVVIGEILRRLELDEDEVLPMSYTGQACMVMRQKGLRNACTCHSGLYHIIREPVIGKDGKPLVDPQFNIPITKSRFIRKDLSDTNIKLIIIDEAWMLPYRFRKDIDATGIKVIAAGDPGQLPPIASKPGYLMSGKVFYLTELMRQSEKSPIVYLANRARNGLPIEPGLYGNDALVIYDDEFDSHMLENSDIILCSTNKTKDEITNNVRHNILGLSDPIPRVGERMICRKNNWEKEVDGIPLVNGLTGRIVSPPDIGNFNGKLLKLDFWPDYSSIPFIDIHMNYEYLTADYDKKRYMKESPYTFGDLFDFAYASTVHLSQGSEYNSGVYLEEFRSNPAEQNALNYTAITRFRHRLIYVKQRPRVTWICG